MPVALPAATPSTVPGKLYATLSHCHLFAAHNVKSPHGSALLHLASSEPHHLTPPHHSRPLSTPSALPLHFTALLIPPCHPLPCQVIVAGNPSQPATTALLNAAHAAWAPDKAVILINPTDPESVAFWQQHNPEAWAMVEAHFQKQQQQQGGPSGAIAAGAAGPAAGGGAEEEGSGGVAASEVAAAGGADGGVQPTAFVCQNYTCQAPTSEPGKVYELLSRAAASGPPGSSSGLKLQPVKL